MLIFTAILLFTSFIAGAQVVITTDSARPMATVFSASLVDCFFTGKASAGNYRNVTASPFVDHVRALGYKHLLYPGDGSIAQKHHAPTVGGSGYHLLRADFPSDAAFNSYNGGVATVQWPSSFAVDAIRLCDSVGAVCDYVANVRHGNAAEDRWFIDNARPGRIKWGSELLIDWNGTVYVDSVMRRIANINNIIHVIDAGLVWRTNHRKTVEWNAAVAALPLPEADTYWQLSDRVGIGSDMRRNGDSVMRYFDEVLPADLAAFKSTFPGKRMFVGQMNVEDTRADIGGSVVKHIDNTMLATYAIGRFYVFALQHTDDVSYVCWQSLRNLIDRNDQPSNNYYALQLCNRLQEVTHIGGVTLPDGVDGVAGWSDSLYFLLICNGTPEAIEVASVYVNKKEVTKHTDLHAEGLWAYSWSDTIRRYTTTARSITLQPYSVTVVTFDRRRAEKRSLASRVLHFFVTLVDRKNQET